jgi:hypothetical protein
MSGQSGQMGTKTNGAKPPINARQANRSADTICPSADTICPEAAPKCPTNLDSNLDPLTFSFKGRAYAAPAGEEKRVGEEEREGGGVNGSALDAHDVEAVAIAVAYTQRVEVGAIVQFIRDNPATHPGLDGKEVARILNTVGGDRLGRVEGMLTGEQYEAWSGAFSRMGG